MMGHYMKYFGYIVIAISVLGFTALVAQYDGMSSFDLRNLSEYAGARVILNYGKNFTARVYELLPGGTPFQEGRPRPRPRPGEAGYNCSGDDRYGLAVKHGRRTRLGNTMYIVAAMINIAEANNLKPVLSPHMVTYIRAAFGIEHLFCSVSNEDIQKCYQNATVDIKEFNDSLILPQRALGKNVFLTGYYQNRTKFLLRVEDRMREIYKFKPQVLAVAKAYIQNVSGDGWLNVGVHLRAGAFERLAQHWGRKGFILPGNDYFLEAFRYFDALYGKVRYVVCSYDRSESWIKANFNLSAERMVVNAQKFSPSVDMAILSQCEHVITSLGTYGWWAGWSSPGVMVYPSARRESGNPDKPRGAVGLPSLRHQRKW